MKMLDIYRVFDKRYFATFSRRSLFLFSAVENLNFVSVNESEKTRKSDKPEEK